MSQTTEGYQNLQSQVATLVGRINAIIENDPASSLYSTLETILRGILGADFDPQQQSARTLLAPRALGDGPVADTELNESLTLGFDAGVAIALESLESARQAALYGDGGDDQVLGIRTAHIQAVTEIEGKKAELLKQIGIETAKGVLEIMVERQRALNAIEAACQTPNRQHSIDPSRPEDRGPSSIFWPT
jgi:hypothetical protein